MFHFLNVLLILVTSATGSLVAKQASVLPSSSPTLTFNIPPQVLTCKSSTFSWNYSGPNNIPNLHILLYISNTGVDQLDPPSSPSPSSTPTKPLGRVQLRTIALSPFEGFVPIRDTNFTWPNVWTPRGWWFLEADLRAANYTTRSAPFFVEESDDTSCLPPPPTSSASRQYRFYSNEAGMLIGTFVLGTLSHILIWL